MYNIELLSIYNSDRVFLETDVITESEKDFVRDVIYRQEILKIFGLAEYTETALIREIYILYERIKGCQELKECMRKLGEITLNMHGNEFFNDTNNDTTDTSNTTDKMDSLKNSIEEIGLIVLFSFDYLYLTHNCVCEYLESGEITNESLSKLRSKIF